MFALSGSGATIGPASGSFEPPVPRDPEEPPAPLPPEFPLPPALLPPPVVPLPPFPALLLAPLAALPPFGTPPDTLIEPPDALVAAPPLPASPCPWLESDEPQAIRRLKAGKTEMARERSGMVVLE